MHDVRDRVGTGLQGSEHNLLQAYVRDAVPSNSVRVRTTLLRSVTPAGPGDKLNPEVPSSAD